eukprot:Nk52_evm10s207 gene=Nk52_evmTU10s207
MTVDTDSKSGGSSYASSSTPSTAASSRPSSAGSRGAGKTRIRRKSVSSRRGSLSSSSDAPPRDESKICRDDIIIASGDSVRQQKTKRKKEGNSEGSNSAKESPSTVSSVERKEADQGSSYSIHSLNSETDPQPTKEATTNRADKGKGQQEPNKNGHLQSSFAYPPARTSLAAKYQTRALEKGGVQESGKYEDRVGEGVSGSTPNIDGYGHGSKEFQQLLCSEGNARGGNDGCSLHQQLSSKVVTIPSVPSTACDWIGSELKCYTGVNEHFRASLEQTAEKIGKLEEGVIEKDDDSMTIILKFQLHSKGNRCTEKGEDVNNPLGLPQNPLARIGGLSAGCDTVTCIDMTTSNASAEGEETSKVADRDEANERNEPPGDVNIKRSPSYMEGTTSSKAHKADATPPAPEVPLLHRSKNVELTPFKQLIHELRNEGRLAVIQRLLDDNFHKNVPSKGNAFAINSTDTDGTPPLTIASANGNASACEILLGYGAKVNQVSGKGNTALHRAVLALRKSTDSHRKKNLHKCIKMLVAAGANPLAENGQGETAYAIASQVKDQWTMRLLGKQVAHKLVAPSIGDEGNQRKKPSSSAKKTAGDSAEHDRIEAGEPSLANNVNVNVVSSPKAPPFISHGQGKPKNSRKLSLNYLPGSLPS